MDLFTFIQCCLFGNVLLVSIALSLLLSLLSSHHVFFKLITFITFLTIFATPIVNFILQSNNSSYWFWSLVFSCWVDAKLSKSICLSFGTIFTWDFLNSFSTWIFFLFLTLKLWNWLPTISKQKVMFEFLKFWDGEKTTSDSGSFYESILGPVNLGLSSQYSNADTIIFISTEPFLELIWH